MNLELESKEIGAIKKLILKEPIDTKKLFDDVDFEKAIEDKEVILEIKKMAEKKAGRVEWVLENQEVKERESLEGYLETLKGIRSKVELVGVKEEDVK